MFGRAATSLKSPGVRGTILLVTGLLMMVIAALNPAPGGPLVLGIVFMILGVVERRRGAGRGRVGSP